MVDVYLDAVFFPKCVEDFQTFQQEGWHYELNNPSEAISYKGYIFFQTITWHQIFSPKMDLGNITKFSVHIWAMFYPKKFIQMIME